MNTYYKATDYGHAAAWINEYIAQRKFYLETITGKAKRTNSKGFLTPLEVLEIPQNLVKISELEKISEEFNRYANFGAKVELESETITKTLSELKSLGYDEAEEIADVINSEIYYKNQEITENYTNATKALDKLSKMKLGTNFVKMNGIYFDGEKHFVPDNLELHSEMTISNMVREFSKQNNKVLESHKMESIGFLNNKEDLFDVILKNDSTLKTLVNYEELALTNENLPKLNTGRKAYEEMLKNKYIKEKLESIKTNLPVEFARSSQLIDNKLNKINSLIEKNEAELAKSDFEKVNEELEKFEKSKQEESKKSPEEEAYENQIEIETLKQEFNKILAQYRYILRFEPDNLEAIEDCKNKMASFPQEAQVVDPEYQKEYEQQFANEKYPVNEEQQTATPLTPEEIEANRLKREAEEQRALDSLRMKNDDPNREFTPEEIAKEKSDLYINDKYSELLRFQEEEEKAKGQAELYSNLDQKLQENPYYFADYIYNNPDSAVEICNARPEVVDQLKEVYPDYYMQLRSKYPTMTDAYMAQFEEQEAGRTR